MEKFMTIAKGLHLLKIPFGPVWTGVVLVQGQQRILIDSGARDEDVDNYIIPALAELGLKIGDIDYLANTHSHGDHIGGNHRLRQLGRFQMAAFQGSAPKVINPVPYAIETRTRFPRYSPQPQSQLQGVRVDVILRDGDALGDRLQLVHTPGHDDDCVCWYDRRTKTLITGDSLQGGGTVCQGVAFYKSLPDYRATLQRLASMDIENILCGHDYAGIGYHIVGRENVRSALRECAAFVQRYARFVARYLGNGATDPALIARALIDREGCGVPDKLFMALYTVTEHIDEIKRG